MSLGCASPPPEPALPPALAPRGARPLGEARIDVQLGQIPWAGARCEAYPRWYRNGMWSEWAERGLALSPSPARDALVAVLRSAEPLEGLSADGVDALGKRVGDCTTCSEAELVGQLTLALLADPPEATRAAALGAEGSTRFPESPFAPMFLRPLVATPDGRALLLDRASAGGPLGQEAALLLACDEPFTRAADAGSLARLTDLPEHPETLPFPLASRWLALGQPEPAAAMLDRARIWLDRPAEMPECANGPSGRPSELCFGLVDGAQALVAALPVGTRPELESHLEVQVRRAVHACAPNACGDVQGTLADGVWTWAGENPAFEGCVRGAATSVGWDVPRASVTVRSGVPCR